MRRVLEDDLLYTTEEVDVMDPSIAAVVIKKGLARPMPGGMPRSWKKRRVWPLINEKARAKLKARLQKLGEQMKNTLHKIGEQLNDGIHWIEDTWEDHGAPIAGQIRHKLSIFRNELHKQWISLKTKFTAPATFAVTQVLPKIFVGGVSWLILPRIIDAIGFCVSVIIGALQMTASLPIRLLPLLSLPKPKKVSGKPEKLPSTTTSPAKVLVSMTSKPTEEVSKEVLSQPTSPIETSRKMTAELIKRLTTSAAEKITAVSKFEDARKQREARDAVRKQQESAEAARKQQREALVSIRQQQEAKDTARRQQEAIETARKQNEAEKAAYEQQRETDEAARRRQQEAEERKQRRETDEIARKQQREEEKTYHKQRVSELAAMMKAAKISAAALEKAQRETKAKILSQSKSGIKQEDKKQLVSSLLSKVTTSIKPETTPTPASSKNNSKPKLEVTSVIKKKIDKKKVDLEMLSKVLR